MIPNTKENREQYLKRGSDRVKYFSNGKWSIPLCARNVAWTDPYECIEGFILLPESLATTEEEDRAWDEIEKRMDVIGQNGNDGEHYDNVNHPQHYQSDNGIECIDAIKAALTPEEFRGYCKGNAMKYLWRERMKGGDESLRKANWYINKELER